MTRQFRAHRCRRSCSTPRCPSSWSRRARRSGAEPRRPLTDPKEILTETVLSLKDVKSVEFTGYVHRHDRPSPELGATLDLSTVTMSGAADIAGKKAKFGLDAPTLLGTKIDALLLDTVAYYKIAGTLGDAGGGGSADKYTKVDVPASSGKPVTDAAELDKAIDELKTASTSSRRRRPRAPTRSAATRTATTSRSS